MLFNFAHITQVLILQMGRDSTKVTTALSPSLLGLVQRKTLLEDETVIVELG